MPSNLRETKYHANFLYHTRWTTKLLISFVDFNAMSMPHLDHIMNMLPPWHCPIMATSPSTCHSHLRATLISCYATLIHHHATCHLPCFTSLTHHHVMYHYLHMSLPHHLSTHVIISLSIS